MFNYPARLLNKKLVIEGDLGYECFGVETEGHMDGEGIYATAITRIYIRDCGC